MSGFTFTNRAAMVGPVTKQVKKAALSVLRDATRWAPYRYGTLSRSYTVENQSTGTEARYVVGTNVFYAPFQEFGTSRMAARPHLGPALHAAHRKYGGTVTFGGR